MSTHISTSELLDMAWTRLSYDRQRVNKAGQALVNNNLPENEQDAELVIVNNWRSAHSYPLHCLKMNLKERALKIDRKAIIAQRLKRLPSIQAKLKREPLMKLTQMQDIGGCRAVLPTINDVDLLVKVYQEAKIKNPHRRHERVNPLQWID